jgi:[NiFe] hydrogenase diaphorase moiety large subunit
MTTLDIIRQVRQKFVADYPSEDSLLLQYLQALQHAKNAVPATDIELLSEHCRVSASTVQQVIDFYSFLTTQTPVRYLIRISDNIVDRMQGSQRLAQELCRAFAISPGINSPDNRLRIELTSCIGMSDLGPALLVNDTPVTRLDEERTQQMIDWISQDLHIDEWPADWLSVNCANVVTGQLMQSECLPGAALQKLDDPQAIIDTISASGLRGRGGAGFPTGRKWQFCRQTEATQRYVVCNADEGEPGTFKDRHLLQHHALAIIEGMKLCARAIGANQGFIYLRGEYRYLLPDLNTLLQQLRRDGFLGKNCQGLDGFDFDIDIHLGAGAYICGEESALLESLEGKPGIPRNRPPFPVQQGYLQQPTVVNNVETFMAAALIAINGADWFRIEGTEKTTGSKLMSISGDCARPGIYEVPFGIRIDALLALCGADDTAFVQVGGAAGRTLSVEQFSHKLCYEDVATAGSFMVFNKYRDLFATGQNFTDFFVHESCGFCTPCRVGTSLQADLFRRLVNGQADSETLRQLDEIQDLLQSASHCGLGSSAANFYSDIKVAFQSELSAKLVEEHIPDIDLAEARQNNHLQGQKP